MRIQESEYRIQEKNNTRVILAPAFSCFVVPASGMAVSKKEIISSVFLPLKGGTEKSGTK